MEIWLDEPSFPKNIILVMKLYSQSSNIIEQNLGFVTVSIPFLWIHVYYSEYFKICFLFFDLNNLVSILITISHLSYGLLTFQSCLILLIIVNHRICSNVLSSSTRLLYCTTTKHDRSHSGLLSVFWLRYSWQFRIITIRWFTIDI